MSNRQLFFPGLLLLTVALCATLPTRGQEVKAPNQPPAQLPEGDGKATVQAACGACHSLSQVTNAGYDREEWDTVLHMMINVGAPLPQDKFDTVLNYLAAHFPPKPRPEAKMVAGPAAVTIKEWVVPTPGSRPHDPMYAPDGSVWYTGQMANVLGRFDPKAQTFKEYKLPPKSGPHGLAADTHGNVWYTANFAAYIGKLDPATGNVTQYRMPDPRARDPHTLIFGRPGPDLLYRAGWEHGGTAGREDRRDQARGFADASVKPVRHGGHLEGDSVFRGIRREQDRQHRSADAAHSGVRVAAQRKPAAARGHHCG